MKKLVIFFLAVLLVFILIGCSRKEDVQKNNKTVSEQLEVTTEKVNGKKWKDAYIAYIDKNKSENDIETYQLININNDSIPELYINYGTTAGGEMICTYVDGEVIVQSMWDGGFSYIEGENLFRDSGGHMDSYYDKIYSIRDGKIKLLYSGEYGIEDNANVLFDENENPVYEYQWEGEKIDSEAKYQKLLNEVFNTREAISPFDGAEYHAETSRYTGKGLCNYNEIVKAIEAYK